jgi:tRNA wybutosine-synthesizing protein 1
MNIDKKILEKQGYRFTGDHSSVKICSWTKSSLQDKGDCYKQKFYGIKTHRCAQMTPSMVCPNRCVFCWRDLDYYTAEKMGEIDDPKEIIKNTIEQQRKLLSGMKGNKNINLEKFQESQNPNQFAISLTGEPTIYPKLNELLIEIHNLNATSFLVTNGMFPDALKNLKELPTQIYLSLDAPTKEMYGTTDNPIMKDFWERLNESLKIFSELKTRKVIRITAVKGINMSHEEDYANLIKIANPDWVEIKSYSFIGESRARLMQENVPSFEECKFFAEKIGNFLGMKIINTHKRSKAILLAKKETENRLLNK